MTTKSLAIAFPLRAWLAVEVLFGVAAVLAVGLAPADTATNFAWPIQPVVMAAVFYHIKLAAYNRFNWAAIRQLMFTCFCYKLKHPEHVSVVSYCQRRHSISRSFFKQR